MGENKDGSAPGPDGITTKVILELNEELVQPLIILFGASLETARIAEEWRDAIVSPIFKKGKKTEPSNYRPVSLTSQTHRNKQPVTQYAAWFSAREIAPNEFN